MTALLIFAAAVYGLCFGSFANVVIHRVPLGMSIVSPGSHCPACGCALKPAHLVPVLSWLCLRGKCAFCGAVIPARYTAVELLTACLFALTAWRYQNDGFLEMIFICGLMVIMVIIGFIDAKTMYIPVFLLVCGAVLGAIRTVCGVLKPGHFIEVLKETGLSVLLGFGVLFVIDLLCRVILRKQGFGMGDMLLMAVCGLFMSARDLALAYYAAIIIGGVWASVLVLRKKRGLGTYFSFSPCLCMGVALELLY